MNKLLLTAALCALCAPAGYCSEATAEVPAAVPAETPALTEAPAETPSITPTTDLLNISARVRGDWSGVWRKGSGMDDAASGFEGKYLMVRFDGSIVPGLTYSWRQRFNKSAYDSSFWDATDWIYLDWATHGWNFSAGKQIVLIGGWEYDRNPVDLYSTSVFWQNVACYQWGASAGYHLTAGDALTFQATQSMFHTSENRNLYGYNLFWNGRHGLYHALWSVNLTEYRKGKYINYITLGNRFDLGAWEIELDLMNRAASHQAFWFKDCSVIGEIAFRPHPAWRIHGKMTYDVNRSGTGADFYVQDGTELKMAGGGVEFFPLRKARTALRLHANCYHSWGHNSNSADIMQHGTTVFNVGLTFDFNLLNLKRK